LEHYASAMGMVFAVSFKGVVRWFTEVDQLAGLQSVVVKGCSALALCVATCPWLIEIHVLPKSDFNTWHPYTFFIPLLAFVFLRNVSKTFRGYCLGPFRSLGRVTLETYLLQHHLLMNGKSKTILVVVPGLPLVNLGVVSVVFFGASQVCFQATGEMKDALLGSEPLRNLGILTLATAALTCFAALVQRFLATLLGTAVAVCMLAAVWVICCRPPKVLRALTVAWASSTVAVAVLSQIPWHFVPASAPASPPQGAGAGVASDPLRGLLVLGIASVMLWSGDGFAGSLWIGTALRKQLRRDTKYQEVELGQAVSRKPQIA